MPAPLDTVSPEIASFSIPRIPLRTPLLHNAIRHIHKRTRHPAFRPRTLQQILRPNIRIPICRNRHARRLDPRQQRGPLRSPPSASSSCRTS